MTQRELDLKAIIYEFSIWEASLANHNSLNLQDNNLISEYTICEILNCIFDYELKNANATKCNYAAVDLIDSESRIAFQITTTRTTQKVQETLNKFMAHNLHKIYEQLYVLVLGKKQKSYTSLQVPAGIVFDPSNNILDFKMLLNHINFLPTSKLSQVKSIIQNTAVKTEKPGLTKVAAMQKKTLSMKTKFYKNFIENDRSLRDYSPFNSFRCYFQWGSVILRDVGDRTFPGGDPNHPKWTKYEFFDMYDYGVIFFQQAGYAVVDADEYWDLLNVSDGRSSNPQYRKIVVWAFYYLAFENMIAFEMEPDDYYGYPTIFCHFKHKEWPFEYIKFGRLGSNDELHAAYYFDNAKRKTLP